MLKKLLTIVACLTILVSCASNHAKPPAITPSEVSNFSDAQKFSADTNARIKKIQDDYGVKIFINDHRITVGTAGLVTKERMKSIEDALQDVIGNDFTNYTIINLVD
jgi:hypothetical protein